MKKKLLLMVMFLSIIILLGITANGSDYIILNETGKKIILYDLDGDGKPEIFIDNKLVRGNMSIFSFTGILVKTTKYTHTPVLFLITQNEIFVVKYSSLTPIYEFNTTANIKNIERYPDGVVIETGAGSYILTYMKIFSVERNNIIPLCNGKDYGYLYYDENIMLVINNETVPLPVQGLSEIITAKMYKNLVTILARTSNISLIINYDLTSKSISIKFLDYKIINAYIYKTFIVGETNSGTVIISINGEKVKTLNGKPFFLEDHFTIYKPGNITVYNDNLEKIYSVGYYFDIVDIDYYNSVLAVLSKTKTYIFGVERVKRDAITLNVDVPSRAEVLSTVTIRATGNYSNLTILVDGEEYSIKGNGTVTFVPRKIGNYTLVFKACSNITCVTEIRKLAVTPRRAELEIIAPEHVTLYDNVDIVLKIVDDKGAMLSNLTCHIMLDNKIINTTSLAFKSIQITEEEVTSDFTVPVRAECLSPIYGLISAHTVIKVKPYIDINITYLGGGLARITAFNNITMTPLNKRLLVSLNNTTRNVTNPTTIKLLPGKNIVIVRLVYKDAVIEKKSVIQYYPNIYEVPSGKEVVVADRVTTTTVNIGKTETITSTITLPKPVIRTEVDIVLVIVSSIIGATLGLVGGRLLSKQKRKK